MINSLEERQMSTIATFDYAQQGWEELNSEDELLAVYPKHVWGTYRPQPWSTPEKYPCLYKELAVMDNSNGSDHAMLAFIYDYKPAQ
jgi:hypothetical protein